jgi:hypothetical protein
MRSNKKEQFVYVLLVTIILGLMGYLGFDLTVGAQPGEAGGSTRSKKTVDNETQFAAGFIPLASVELWLKIPAKRDRYFNPIITPTPIPTRAPTATPTPKPPEWAGDQWELLLCMKRMAKVVDVYKKPIYVKKGQVLANQKVLVKDLIPPNRMILQHIEDPTRIIEVVKRSKKKPSTKRRR